MIAPLMSMIQMLPAIIQGYVSLNRILEFIEEIKNFKSGHLSEESSDMVPTPVISALEADEKEATSMEPSTVILNWKSNGTTWNSFNLNITPGNVVILLGPSGSGKSQLIRSMLQASQPMLLCENSLTKRSKLAFCDQNPWFIPNLSIRDNIILGKELHMDLYCTIISSCCLQHDISTFIERDGKIIHDASGTCLSGGQRKRIALARALYREPTLLILDDVFSGLDLQTQTQIE